MFTWNKCVTKKEGIFIALMLNLNIFWNIEVSDYTAVVVPTKDGQLKWQQTTSIQLMLLNRFTGSQPSY